jgi:hypothetical protein
MRRGHDRGRKDARTLEDKADLPIPGECRCPSIADIEGHECRFAVSRRMLNDKMEGSDQRDDYREEARDSERSHSSTAPS